MGANMTTLKPLHYRINIVPDLNSFKFQGEATIRFQADDPLDTISLNILELAIWQCRLRKEDDWLTLSFEVEPSREMLHVRLPEALQGEVELQIDYEGLVNDQMAGFYRSRFTKDDQIRYIAVTQFQESSARQAFPCLDHPLHKAVFELEMTVPADLQVLANTLPVSEEVLEGGARKVLFAPTPRMSTYLVFFGLGQFELVQDNQDERVRLAHLPGLAHTTELGLTFGRKALQFCEQYYDLDYPLPKMDLIGVPDFAYGAMENWGAITFRENLLLQFPELTSKTGIQRICEVIAHEIAHQWFGNLVTPADWKFLWLNESFATFFGYGVVAHYEPQWQVWHQFLHNETATALARDGLEETFAIEIPGGDHVVINSSTAPIIYNKGASILRMIQGQIGQDNYRQGVRNYLKEHQYECARSHHLWEAFEGASDQPITAMMKSWIGQPGHPLITADRQGDTLMLRQQRFTYLDASSDQTWTVPITVSFWSSDGRRQDQTEIMADSTITLDLPSGTDVYKLNIDQTGFYRVCYADTDNLANLGRCIQNQTMGPEDRWGIQNDLFALVRQGRVPMADYLAYLSYFDQEQEYLPLISISGHLYQAMLTTPADRRPDIAAYGRALAQRVLERIGYAPASEDLQTTAMLREQLLWQAVLWGADQATDFAVQQFKDLMAGQNVHADIAKAVMQSAAWTQGADALTWLFQRFGESPSEHERLNILAALGAFDRWELTEKALAFTLEKVPPRNRFIPIAAAAVNPAAQPHLWDWYQTHLATLEGFHPLLYERVITSIWPYGGLDREDEVHSFGQNYIQTHPNLADAVKLALENLEINSNFRKRTE